MGQPSQDELDQVNVCRAKWEAAKRVWARRKTKSMELRRMLAGQFPSMGQSSAAIGKDANAAVVNAALSEQTNTNLGLRMTTSLKASACDESWDVRASNPGDFPDELINPVETALTKVIEEAGLPDEYRDSIDDIATIGPGIIWYGVGTRVIDQTQQDGLTQEIGDLVTSAANAKPGDPPVHPVKGMNFTQVAKACRDFLADPDQAMLRTLDQQANLTRVAQEADQMWADQLDAVPSGIAYDGIWYERLAYGEEGVLWDPTKTTR